MQPRLPAFEPGNCPPLSFPPSPSSLQIFIIKGLHAPQHYLIILGRVCVLQNTGWKRVTFFLKDSWPQTEEEAPLSQACPAPSVSTRHLFSSTFIFSFRPGSKANGGKPSLLFHCVTSRRAVPSYSRIGFFPILGTSRVPYKRWEILNLYANAHQ